MNIVQKIIVLFLTALAPFLGLVTRVYAEEIVISENGSGSQSQVHTEQTNTVDVNQSNDADVNNNVDVTADTGNNQTNDNTASDTSITTGNASVETGISNNVNASVAANDPCCPSGGSNTGTTTISGNGKNSQNAVTITSSFTANAQVTNAANITNNIYGKAVTGNNKANDNNGDVAIKTGNIKVTEQIINNANASYVQIASPLLGKDYLYKISGNGSGSDNAITDNLSNNVVIAVNNHANIFNNSFWELVTGNNEANDNNGDVYIETGDIKFESTIKNNANISLAIVTCCKKEEHKPEAVVPPEKPVTPKPHENGKGGNGNGNGHGNGKGEGPGEALEGVLPVTGNLWFFLALIGNIAMLIFGTYLRLRSGRSPAVVAA